MTDVPARRGVARCAAAAALFGATTPAAGRLAGETSAPMLAGLLYLGAALAVAPFALHRRPGAVALRQAAGRLGVAVIAGGFLGPLLLVAGLARTPAATASLLLNLEVVATVGFAAVLFREHVGRRVATGACAVMAAGALLGWTDVPHLRVGALFVVGACVCWGLDNCVTAELDALAPEHITLAKGVIAGTTNLALAFIVGSSKPDLGVVVAALAVGAVGYGASITLWVAGARDLGAARGQLIFATAPFVGVVVAWTAFNGAVRPVEVAAMLLAGFGVSRLLGSDHLHEHHHDRVEHEHAHAHDDGHHSHEHREEPSTTHSHRHVHEAIAHAHPHIPDLHHRHTHSH